MNQTIHHIIFRGWFLLFFMSMVAPALYAQSLPVMNPLNIGDTVPDVVFDHILNYKSTTAKLSDFRGKPVILDFFGTWCGACIWSLPKLDRLQSEFGDKLQILVVDNYEIPEKIESFLKKNPTGKNISLPVVATGTDSTLKRYFPYQTIPHEVWLNASGVVAAITSSRYITRGNLERLVAGETLELPVKKDVVVNFDRDKPLLENGNGGGKDHLLYRSTLTSYLPGVFSGGGYSMNEDSTLKRVYQVNVPIISLYHTVLQFPENRVILEVKDPSRFVPGKADPGLWFKTHTYCYEAYIPLNASKSSFYAWMIQDLNRWFGLDGHMEKRMVSCWALIRTSKDDKLLITKGEKAVVRLSNSLPVKILKNEPLSLLADRLNSYTEDYGKPIFLDETGFKQNVDLSLNVKDIHDIPALKKALRSYGLDLIRVKRSLDMFVLSDNKE